MAGGLVELRDQVVDDPGAHGAALRFKLDDQFALLITQFPTALQGGRNHGPAVFIPVGVSSFEHVVEFGLEVVGAQGEVGGDLFDVAVEFFIAGCVGEALASSFHKRKSF